nr:hypothetical protein [Candidatus Stoquefichus massiliensis]
MHHLIPNEVLVQFLKKYDVNKTEMNYLVGQSDSDWNAIVLLMQGNAVCHLESHNFYDELIRTILFSRE